MGLTKKHGGRKMNKRTRRHKRSHFSRSRKHKKRHLGKHKRRHSKKQRGGTCGCSAPTQLGSPVQMGGTCGCSAPTQLGSPVQMGGTCGCSAPTQLGSALQAGGSCCGQTAIQGAQLGGSGDPLVGSPWTGKVSTWPGVAGIEGETNHYALNKYYVDPQTAMVSTNDSITLRGGQKNKGGKIKQKAGSSLVSALTPTPISTLSRGLGFNVHSAYNILNGNAPPSNPSPYVQPALSN